MTAAPRLHLRLRFEPGKAASLEPVVVEGAGYYEFVELDPGDLRRNRRTPLNTSLNVQFGGVAPVRLPALTELGAGAARVCILAWANAWNDHARRGGTVDRDHMRNAAWGLAGTLRTFFADHDVAVEAYCDAMGGVL